MPQNNHQILKTGENTLLVSITLEVDDIFLKLRKADQIIRRELNLLTQTKNLSLKRTSISPINEEKLRNLIEQLPLQDVWVDEYVTYILKNEQNSIFNLINKYNIFLEKRQSEPNSNIDKIIDLDEKLVHQIRHLGAMTYHLNIHLNLVKLLLENTFFLEEYKQRNMKGKIHSNL